MGQRLLIMGGSVRSCADEETIIHATKQITNEPDLYEYIEHVARCHAISNSEGSGIAVAYGAMKYTNDIKYVRLNEYINSKGQFHQQQELLDLMIDADGYVFLTPVYFGDRSSLLFDLFTAVKQHGLDFDGKVSAVASVGAKRNGGQETTNIYTLYNLMQMKSLAVGNGPPTSQYGGTLVGGNKGTMDNDYFGIMTAMGVGTKISQTMNLLEATGSSKPVISFWFTEDMPDRRYYRYLKSLLPKLPATAEWRILDLLNFNFHQCFACNRCPYEMGEHSYKCVIRDDDMAIVQPSLLESDGFIVCGLNYEDEAQKQSVYQRFVERTRYIRRNDFMLTNHPFMTLSMNELFADHSYDLKAFTAFLRHNTIAHRGLRVFETKHGLEEPDMNDCLHSFVDITAKSKSQRMQARVIQKSAYEAIGYESKWQ
ncbi:flavodoxin family protein [candidate division KSB1 bacterium]|nr:flavodoxin family protein [candidate division KSB1 bacterium]